jgi:hypothetical protein
VRFGSATLAGGQVRRHRQITVIAIRPGAGRDGQAPYAGRIAPLTGAAAS